MAASQLVAALEIGGRAVDPAIMRRLEDKVWVDHPLLTTMPDRTVDASRRILTASSLAGPWRYSRRNGP